MTLVVLKPYRGDRGFFVRVHDDRDDYELFRTLPFATLDEALADARDTLHSDEQIADEFECEELP